MYRHNILGGRASSIVAPGPPANPGQGASKLPPIYIAYLNRLDIEELKMTDDEILSAIEASLASQGRGETVIEPRVHLEPGVANGHFNVLRGAIKPPIDSAGVKIVGDFVDNYKIGFPSELAILALFDPRTGAQKAILDASGITDMRTGAVTAVGAKHLARKNSKSYRCPRDSLLERASSQPSVRFRRDPRAFAPRGEPQRLCGAIEPGSRQARGG